MKNENIKTFYNKGIPGDWEVKKLYKFCEFITKGATPTTYGFTWVNDGVIFLRSECVGDSGLELNAAMFISDDADKVMKRSSIYEGDILMTITGNVGRVCQVPKDFPKANINQHIARIRITEKGIEKDFIFQYLKQDKIQKEYLKITTGQAYPQISLEQVRQTKIPLPSLPEQRAIAACLTTWDKAIAATQILIEQKQLKKKWLMQNLLTGKKRLKGFSGEWKEIHIRDFSKEVSIRNGENKQLTVLSCTKYDGLVPSLEYFGRKIYSDNVSTYKIVPANHFAYATNHIEEGSIGYQDMFEEALISPMYTIFKTDENINDNFFYRLLKSHRLIYEYNARMEGSIDRRGGLRWDAFSVIKIKIPSIKEQTAIAQILQTADKEIKLLQSKLEKLRKQKKGLMQVLLTGKKRLKVD